MSFNNTKSPLKPNCKPKYQVPMRKHLGYGPLEYYLTPELESEFRRLFPVNTNRRMMQLFGISFSTVERFKRELGLAKDKKVIIRKQAEMTKRICEKNGYYASIRGRKPSDAAIEATKKMWAAGFHPMKALKERNPRKYKRIIKKRSETRREQIRREKCRLSIGLEPRTNLHIPVYKYDRKQIHLRYTMKERGYILGDMRENSGERYTIFFDADTERSAIIEKHAEANGFSVRDIVGLSDKKRRKLTAV